MTNEYRYFLESNFVAFNRLFVLDYSNQDSNYKRFKTRWYYSPKEWLIIINYSELSRTILRINQF